ncbi:MAG: virginiamycin lyase, partial [Solirubrobacteraceae bacterium]|nr:virginiamycin lyase [Solirubrobacteraceae bacterium]
SPATGVVFNGAALSGSVNPHGTATKFHFEYGPTTGYGSSTPDADAGSDASDHAVSQTIGDLQPNTTYHYRVVATDGMGFVTKGTDIGFTTPAAPPTDADKDGVAVPQDCNDNNPAIHPGAIDVPGNGVDEDCSGADAIVVLSAGFTNKWTVFKTYTTVFTLGATKVPAGGKVILTCKGKGCKFKKKTITAKTAKTVSLTKYFNYKVKSKKTKRTTKVVTRLKAKAVVGITVVKPNAYGNWFTATIQKGLHFPKTKQGCLTVNSTSSKVKCPK